MRRQSGLWAGLLLATSSHAMAKDMEAIQLIVKYKNTPKSLISFQKKLAQITELPISSLSPMAGGAYTVRFNIATLKGGESAENQILYRLRKDPNLSYAVKDRIGHFQPLPETSHHPLKERLSHDLQWDEFTAPAGIMLESAPGRRDAAWAITTGLSSEPVVVAVLDTGVENNVGLYPNLLKNEDGQVWGWNFSGQDSNLSDETGSYHGTHVSGTIAGYGDVMTGVGEDLKILTVKIPDASGMFYESSVVNGIYWAVGAEVPGTPKNPYPAKVLNMRFGVDKGPGKEIEHCDVALEEALNFARKKGAVVVVAAGNDNHWEHYNAPAVCNGTIKVASTGPEGLRAYYSNYGPGVTLAAPGGDKRYGEKGGILSTVNPSGGYEQSGFAFYQGTSMASPHVAGVAGLLFAVSNSTLSPERVEQILYTTTHDFGKSHDDNVSCIGNKPCGHGILDAEHAVIAAVNGFDQFFSAPKLNRSEMGVCGQGQVKPLVKKLQEQNAVWTLIQTSCEVDSQIKHPYIIEKEGKIYAQFGSISYQLDQSAFNHCQVIGYDGVGCA